MFHFQLGLVKVFTGRDTSKGTGYSILLCVYQLPNFLNFVRVSKWYFQENYIFQLPNDRTALNPTPDQPIPKELFVISDRACKTMTYLLAMTYNFPAVSFQWVLHSAAMREQKNFRHYMLPVGYR